MSDSNENNPSDPPSQPPANPPGPFSEQIKHQPISARVPERVSRGVFSTGALVMDGPNEFVLDFLQGLTRPHQIVARVVVVPAVLEQMLNAIGDNLNKYSQNFGPPPQLPKNNGPRPTLSDLYENFKISDDLLSGTYANSILVGHSPAEFFLDFITGFYPHAAVSARVIVAPAHVPRILETIFHAVQRRRQQQNPPQPPEGPMNPGGS